MCLYTSNELAQTDRTEGFVMRDFGKICTSMWASLQRSGLRSHSKLLFAYLLSSPHTTMLGCFRLPMAYAVDDLASEDFGEREVRRAFAELSSKGLIALDEAFATVLIPTFLRWNPVENPNQGKAIVKLVAQIPAASSVYLGLIDALRANSGNLPKGFPNDLDTLSKGYRNQEMEQEQEQKQEQQDTPQQTAACELDVYLHSWNDLKGALAIVTRLTAGRKAKLRKRISEGLTPEAFRKLVTTCACTPFLCGENERKWRADFDWLIDNDSNLVRVAEGKYSAVKCPDTPQTRYLTGDPYLDDPAYQSEPRAEDS